MRAAENILQLMQTNKPAKLEIILTGIIATLISAAFVLGRNMSISQTIELSRIDVCAFLLIAIVAKAKLSLNYSCFLNGAHPFCFPPGGGENHPECRKDRTHSFVFFDAKRRGSGQFSACCLDSLPPTPLQESHSKTSTQSCWLSSLTKNANVRLAVQTTDICRIRTNPQAESMAYNTYLTNAVHRGNSEG